MTPPRVIKAQLVAVFNNALQESRQKIHRWKQQCYILCLELNDCAQSFVFVYKFCPNELMRFLKISHWFTGAGGRGGKGDPNLPLPYLKFPPPQTFLTSHPESRFSPCILRNIEYCCVISPFFPLLPPLYFPLFFELPPPALSSPSSRTPATLLSPGPPPPDLFDLAKRTSKKSNRPDNHCSISFFIHVKLVSPKLVLFFFLFIISKWHLIRQWFPVSCQCP